MQDPKSVAGLVPHVEVALLVEIVQQVLCVVGARLAKFVHGRGQPYQCVPEVLANHGPSSDPGQQVSYWQMELCGTVSTSTRRRRDVEVDSSILVGLLLGHSLVHEPLDEWVAPRGEEGGGEDLERGSFL